MGLLDLVLPGKTKMEVAANIINAAYNLEHLPPDINKKAFYDIIDKLQHGFNKKKLEDAYLMFLRESRKIQLNILALAYININIAPLLNGEYWRYVKNPFIPTIYDENIFNAVLMRIKKQYGIPIIISDEPISSDELFNFLNIKKQDTFNKLLDYFTEADSLFVDFVQNEATNNGRESNMAKIRTSVSALVAAIYFTKRVPIKNGKILDSQPTRDILRNTISPFFRYITSTLWEYYSESTCKLSAEEKDGFKKESFELQQNKLIKYSKSIIKMIDSGERNSFGADLTDKITYDLFDEHFQNIMFRMGIIQLMRFR